ncbi:hypothetical protein SND48_17955 [Escherichia coli]|nr:hypothetical protein [Escherichia coli]
MKNVNYRPNEYERYADFIEEAKEDKKMESVIYLLNEHERYADFIEEMLKALKNKN